MKKLLAAWKALRELSEREVPLSRPRKRSAFVNSQKEFSK